MTQESPLVRSFLQAFGCEVEQPRLRLLLETVCLQLDAVRSIHIACQLADAHIAIEQILNLVLA